MARIEVSSSGTYAARAGDVFFIGPTAEGIVSFEAESREPIPVQFTIELNINPGNPNSRLRIETSSTNAETDPTLLVSDGYTGPNTEIDFRTAASSTISVGESVTLSRILGSGGLDAVTIGNDFTVVDTGATGSSDFSIELGDGNDTLTLGDGARGVGIDAGAGDDDVGGGNSSEVISGGAGQDTVDGGGGNDLLLGDRATSNDHLIGGDGADVIVAGIGDTVTGGEGGTDNDSLIVSGGISIVSYDFGDPSSESGTVFVLGEDLNLIGQVNFSEIENVFALDLTGKFDPVSISGALPSGVPDGIVQGTIISEIIDFDYADAEGEQVDNDDAVPPLTGDQDIVSAGRGGDIVLAGEDVDLIFGNEGDDGLFGQNGNDGISGGPGLDLLIGGAGRDILVGGEGDDTLSGDNIILNDGGDWLLGNEGNDRFINVGRKDIVVGGEDPDGQDQDVLDLTDVAGTVNAGGTLTVEYEPGDPEAGTVTFFSNFGFPNGSMTFSEIERVIICFARGTQITTRDGPMAVEKLHVGDEVVTLDHGLQKIRWIGSKQVAARGHLAPVLICRGAMGNERDLLVSPQHRMLVQGWPVEVLFGEEEVLVPAKALINGKTVYRLEGNEVEYFHIMFDQHELIFSEGIPSESFHPGHIGMGSFSEETREEIYLLFPELRNDLSTYSSAIRPSLKVSDGRVLSRIPALLG